jgi:hypothetical protein
MHKIPDLKVRLTFQKMAKVENVDGNIQYRESVTRDVIALECENKTGPMGNLELDEKTGHIIEVIDLTEGAQIEQLREPLNDTERATKFLGEIFSEMGKKN